MVRWILPLLLLTSHALASAAPAPVGELLEVEYVHTVDSDSILVKTESSEGLITLMAIDGPEVSEGSASAFLAAYRLADLLEDSRWQLLLEFEVNG